MEDNLPQPKPLSKTKMALSRIKRRILKHVWLARAGVVGLSFLGVYLTFVIVGFILGKTSLGNFIELSGDFFFTPKEKIQSMEGRTNVLILGKGGSGHEAPDLTDTIILASFSHQNPDLKLISLPRDIWISEFRAKLNSMYFWGNQKVPGGGIVMAKSVVEEISGQKVQYAVVIDFSGFTKIIDTLGGVEVEVDIAFTDKKYPLPGKENDECSGDPEYKCRYEILQFEKGTRAMDGVTALKFARSRNAEGDEGTDLARAARQEKIIRAIVKRALSPKIIFSPRKIANLFKIVKGSLETDLSDSASAILIRRAISAQNNLKTLALPGSLLENPPKSIKFDYLYVFVPKDLSWEQIHKWFNCTLEGINCN